MERSEGGNPARSVPDRASLFGFIHLRPRLAVALVFLTLIVAVVAYRFSVDLGLRRVDLIAREGLRLYAAAGKETGAGAVDAGAVEERVAALAGARIRLPRDEGLFAYQGVTRGKVGKTPAAVVRFVYEGRMCLLVILGRETLRAAGREPALFSASGFISGERDGKVFVFWEQEGTTFLLVSDGDLTSLFGLARRYLT